jgi:hypothetical protein
VVGGVASRRSIYVAARLVCPAGDRGTIAADINDRGEIVLPIPRGFSRHGPRTSTAEMESAVSAGDVGV